MQLGKDIANETLLIKWISISIAVLRENYLNSKWRLKALINLGFPLRIDIQRFYLSESRNATCLKNLSSIFTSGSKIELDRVISLFSLQCARVSQRGSSSAFIGFFSGYPWKENTIHEHSYCKFLILPEYSISQFNSFASNGKSQMLNFYKSAILFTCVRKIKTISKSARCTFRDFIYFINSSCLIV